MAPEHRRQLSDPAALEALANPIRLDLLGFLMEEGGSASAGTQRSGRPAHPALR